MQVDTMAHQDAINKVEAVESIKELIDTTILVAIYNYNQGGKPVFTGTWSVPWSSRKVVRRIPNARLSQILASISVKRPEVVEAAVYVGQIFTWRYIRMTITVNIPAIP